MKNKSDPFVEEKTGWGSTNRKPTAFEQMRASNLKAEVEEAELVLKRAEADLAKVKAKCDHKVSYDVAGFPYDVRYCYSCGKDQGLI